MTPSKISWTSRRLCYTLGVLPIRNWTKDSNISDKAVSNLSWWPCCRRQWCKITTRLILRILAWNKTLSKNRKALSITTRQHSFLYPWLIIVINKFSRHLLRGIFIRNCPWLNQLQNQKSRKKVRKPTSHSPSKNQSLSIRILSRSPSHSLRKGIKCKRKLQIMLRIKFLMRVSQSRPLEGQYLPEIII